MDQIVKSQGVWKSKDVEMNAKKCHMNMSKRLPLLSNEKEYANCCNEWTVITGHRIGSKNKESICLCGMAIRDEYFFMNNSTKNIVVMGYVCVRRHNKAAYDKYVESLKLKGVCWLCNTKHKDLNTHFNSCNHKIKVEKLKILTTNILNNMIINKLYYINKTKRLAAERIEKLKTHRICIDVPCSNLIDKKEPDWKVRCLDCYKKFHKH